MTRTFTAVVNPTAGGDAHAVLRPVADVLMAAGATVTIESSRSLDHAKELATAATERGDIVVAVGGDGTVGGVAAAVVAGGGVLGIVPAGRGNDFARQLGLRRPPADLAAVLLEAQPAAVDVLDAGGTIVLGSVYGGIDSVANEIANRSRFLPRHLVYQAAALRVLIRWRAATFGVEIDDEHHDIRGFNVVVANSGYYGNGLHIAPDARVDDGELDIVAIEHMSKLRIPTLMREAVSGRHVRRPEVIARRGRCVRIVSDRELPVYGDGEPICAFPVSVVLRPGALRVLRPSGVC